MMSIIECYKEGKPAFKWGEEGEKYEYNEHDFMAKVVARGLACRHGKPYRRKIKNHTKLR